jgi:hypothetical protein
MRSARRSLAVAFLLTGCFSVHVATTVAPNADFATFRTFKVLDLPPRRGSPLPAVNHPMVINSVANLALRRHLANAFTGRGYAVDDSTPDFTIAYYASLRDTVITGDYDYGYVDRWGGYRESETSQISTEYVEGTVIVDVVNPKTHELVWRGQGVSDLSDDPEKYSQLLNRTVRAIVQRFPTRQ